MIFMLFSVGVAIAFFVGSLVLLNWGRHLGVRYLKLEGANSLSGFGPIEGAVFALLGLLLAFAVSGALQRFDERRQLIIQEATALGTAYDRLGLLEEDGAHSLRTKLKDYLRARIELYRIPRDFSLWRAKEVFSSDQQAKLVALKTNVWEAAVERCPRSGFQPACALALTSLSSVFELARLRAGASEKHPPRTIYVMLFGLGLGCSLLAGFGMAAAGRRSFVHMISFAGALAITIYTLTDIEFPRLGLINIDPFDQFLVETYEQML